MIFVEQATLGYPARNGQTKWAIENLDLQLPPGHAVGVVGENGAGKSSLLRLLAGIYRPQHGHVVTRGRVVPLLSLSGGFERELTGAENIRLSSMLWGDHHVRTERMFGDIVAFSGLGDAIHDPIRTYSAGMLSRLGFSIATSIDADVWLIDEVLAVGDGRFRRRCENRINSLVRDSRLVVVCSHQLDWLRENCDQVLWLENGRKRQFGPASEVLDAYAAHLAR